MRRRVAERRPKNRSKHRRKGGEKSGSTASGKTFLVVRVVVFLLSASLVVRLCVWVLVLWLFGLSRCWVLGGGLGCPWPLPSWLAAAPVFLVLAPVLVFVRKGDVPRTDPVVSLALLGGIVAIYSPSYQLRQNLAMRLLALLTRRRGSVEEPPRVERALRGGCASFFFLLVILSPLHSCSRSLSQVVSHPVPSKIDSPHTTRSTWLTQKALRGMKVATPSLNWIPLSSTFGRGVSMLASGRLPYSGYATNQTFLTKTELGVSWRQLATSSRT